MIKWKHFLLYWPFVQGIHQSPVNSPYKGQWCGALVFSLICTQINGWVNNGEAGDLRCHHAHYDVTVTKKAWCTYKSHLIYKSHMVWMLKKTLIVCKNAIIGMIITCLFVCPFSCCSLNLKCYIWKHCIYFLQEWILVCWALTLWSPKCLKLANYVSSKPFVFLLRYLNTNFFFFFFLCFIFAVFLSVFSIGQIHDIWGSLWS